MFITSTSAFLSDVISLLTPDKSTSVGLIEATLTVKPVNTFLSEAISLSIPDKFTSVGLISDILFTISSILVFILAISLSNISCLTVVFNSLNVLSRLLTLFLRDVKSFDNKLIVLLKSAKLNSAGLIEETLTVKPVNTPLRDTISFSITDKSCTSGLTLLI